jgi:hypothetical protein
VLALQRTTQAVHVRDSVYGEKLARAFVQAANLGGAKPDMF